MLRDNLYAHNFYLFQVTHVSGGELEQQNLLTGGGSFTSPLISKYDTIEIFHGFRAFQKMRNPVPDSAS